MSFSAMRYLATAACIFLTPVALSAQVDGNGAAAVDLAMKRDFLSAYAKAGNDNPAIRDLVTWQRLRFGDAVFGDYIAFEKTNGDWPGQDVLRSAGEALIPAGYDAQAVIDWFADAAPMTGMGALRLAQAHVAAGDAAEARTVVRDAWLGLSLDARGQSALLDAFGDDLSDLHAARADAVLWRWQTKEAERMLPLLDAGQSALIRARIALIRKAGNIDAAISAVPASLRDDPGLQYDRFNWHAGKGNNSEAITILKAQSSSAKDLGEPWRWSSWRRILARWEMRDGNYKSAYTLASQHHMTAEDSAASYADLEWLSGFLQLRFLNDAEQALAHFDNAAADVESPISLGRAGYWQGRALETLGRQEDARIAYARGGQHQTSFYGLLAAEKLGLPLDPYLTGASDPQDWQNSDVMDNALVQAGFALLQGGERGKAIQFFAEVGKRLEAEDLSRLGAAFAAQGETYFEVLLGKSAAARGLVVPSVYFPLHGVAKMDLPVSPALALAISRRESEFNIAAGSPVGAQGLMQLMPGTARDVARSLNMPYEKSRLTTDWRYNATLGSRYLADLTKRFGDSPVQIAAGYNAGPGRPRDWMKERGDPRQGIVDVIDWIEMIPFRETRNYVQRVTESLPVYEARLSGKVGPIRFTELLMGEGSVVRPVARNDGTLDVPAPVTGPDAELQVAAAPARPVARPVDDRPPLTQIGLTTASVPPSRPVARSDAAFAEDQTAPATSTIAVSDGPRQTLRPVLRPNG